MNKNNQTIEETLGHVLELQEGGFSVVEIMSKYPEYANDIKTFFISLESLVALKEEIAVPQSGLSALLEKIPQQNQSQVIPKAVPSFSFFASIRTWQFSGPVFAVAILLLVVVRLYPRSNTTTLSPVAINPDTSIGTDSDGTELSDAALSGDLDALDAAMSNLDSDTSNIDQTS